MKMPANLLVSALAVVGAVAAIALVVAGGVALADSFGDDDEPTPAELATSHSGPATVIDRDDETPLGAGEIDRVTAAAERIVGPSATVVEIDRSDDLGEAYEVEVITDRGELDIALDDRLQRVPNLRYDD